MLDSCDYSHRNLGCESGCIRYLSCPREDSDMLKKKLQSKALWCINTSFKCYDCHECDAVEYCGKLADGTYSDSYGSDNVRRGLQKIGPVKINNQPTGGNMPNIIRYTHHEVSVAVRQDLKGKHREHCLCYSCAKLTSATGCRKANLVLKNCIELEIVSPVWECSTFEEKTNG